FIGIDHVKPNQLALAQHAAATATNGTEVNENFIAAFAHDKAEAFFDVEPFDRALFITFRSAVVKVVFFVVVIVFLLTGASRTVLATSRRRSRLFTCNGNGQKAHNAEDNES